MSSNISALNYRSNVVAFQTVTIRWKSKIIIINGESVVKENTVILQDNWQGV